MFFPQEALMGTEVKAGIEFQNGARTWAKVAEGWEGEAKAHPHPKNEEHVEVEHPT